MRMKIFSLLLLFTLYDRIMAEKGLFTVIGTDLFKTDQTYRAALSYQGYESEKTFQVGIKNTKEGKNHLSIFKNVTVSGNGFQNIDFDLKNLPESDYVLEVKSDNFEDFQILHTNKKQASVFIQTDKSIYKPSDKILFRVIVLDAETRPFDPSNVEILIFDGADNRVKQFEKPEFRKGVHQNELHLSDLPVMGMWKIHVKISNAKLSEKKFEVAEYVLPKFEVSIDANPDANFIDGVIRATVKATYTFGKIAKGNATVTAELERNTSWERRYMINKKISKSVEVDGKKFVEFDIKNDLGLEKSSDVRNVILSATFTDILSGKEANAVTKITIHKSHQKIQLAKSSDKFKPGLPYKVSALVVFHDKNTPVIDNHNPLKFTITYFYDIKRVCTRLKYGYYYEKIDESNTTQKTEEYDCREEKSYDENTEIFLKNGVAEIDIDMPSNTTKINLKAKYLEIEESLNGITPTESENNEFIHAKLLTEKPSVNDQVQIQVLATKEINQLSFKVFGKGSIIESKTLYFPATKSHVISFTSKVSMIPEAHVIIFYLTTDGEIVSDKIDVKLSNFDDFKLELSTDQAQPGETLNITVLSRPNSFVGLLGVDQSVLLLKKGNDFDQSSVSLELNDYGEIDERHHYQKYPKYDYNHYPDFRFYNAVIITNAKKEFSGHPKLPLYREYDPFEKIKKEMHFMRPLTIDAMILNSDDSDELKLIQLSLRLPSIKPKPIEIRKEFPETWLFENLEFSSDENQKMISKKVPDTITSWIITGFSIDPQIGLGLTKQPLKLNVFQPFFVSTNLPYSIKRGETVAIPIIVFNYMENDQTAEVTLFNDDKEFEFVEVTNEENLVHYKKRALDALRKKTVQIKSNDGVSISFMIRPLKVGHITIKITAASDFAGDGVERQLKVEPEGVTQFLNEALFIDLRNNSSFEKIIKIDIPNNAVPDSTRVETSAIGDILGPSIENLDKLIKLPYGCGEQNMLNFVPNIVVLDYLTNLNKLSPQIESKAKMHMEIGYQRELTYKHEDGSYSSFGKSDTSGSTWLTAFVAKSFNQAAKYILVDEKVVREALDFLSKVQKEDGSFFEVGHVSYKGMQGGSSKGIALTAYTLITFLESKEVKENYQETINKAVNYIVNNFDQLEDNYSLSIATYALQLADHPLKDTFLTKLSSQSEVKDGMKYWKMETTATSGSNSLYDRPNTVNVEMTAYALQAYLEAGRDAESVPIMKWLVTQRNENGGFQSTQDTVVGLQALSKLAAKISSVPNSKLEITVKAQNASPKTIHINEENSLILQKHELSPEARNFEVSAKGQGCGILQISYRYNLDDSVKYPRFVLNPKIESNSNKEFLHLSVCTNFIPDAQTEKSNMAVMEVTLPSGFTFDSDHLSDLLKTERVKKVETKDGDTVVIVYFDDISASQICPEFKAYRTHGVAKQKPAPIIIYDYYDNSRQARTFYNPPEISLCDICADEDECRDFCEVDAIQID